MIGGELGPLAFPEFPAGMIERDRLGAGAGSPGDVDALGIDRRGRGGEGVEFMQVVRLDRSIPDPGLFTGGGVVTFDPAFCPVGCGDGEEKLFPPEHGRGMAEPVELHRPGVVGFGELRFQTRDAADPRAIRAAEAGPFLGMSRAKGKQGGQNEQGSQAHGKGISIEAAKVLERPGRRKAKARRNRVREAKGAPFPMRAAGRCARIPRWSKISSSPRSRSLCSC